MKKENFELKLRLFYLEAALDDKLPPDLRGIYLFFFFTFIHLFFENNYLLTDIMTQNMNMKVQLEEKSKEIDEKTRLLVLCKKKIDSLTLDMDVKKSKMESPLK